MKTKLVFQLWAFFLSVFISCSKDSGNNGNMGVLPAPAPVPLPPSPLAGLEFEFTGLDWSFWDSGFPDWDELSVTTNPPRADFFQNKPGFFYNDYINADVTIKVDPVSGFEQVRPGSLPDPNGQYRYTYNVIAPNLVIWASPNRRLELMGTRAIVRVRFK